MLKFHITREPEVQGEAPRPNAERPTRLLGRALRASSFDQLPELPNVLVREVSLGAPPSLLVKYLPLYGGEQTRRHGVCPASPS